MKCRKSLFATFTGMGTAFCIVAGQNLDVYYTLNLTQISFYIKWAFLSVIFSVVIYCIWTFMDYIAGKGISYNKTWQWFTIFEEKIKSWMIVVFLLLMWCPAWLSIFPGAFSYDAYDEWMQIATKNITAHHPVLHVLLLGGLTEWLYQWTGNYNIGIALYVFLQMVLLASIFAYTIQFMRERKTSPFIRLFAILFYAFSPVVQLFVICCTKDVLFSGAFLLFIISLWRICVLKEVFFLNRKWQIVFCVSACISMVMRNNGLYAVVGVLIIVAVICKSHIRKYIILVAGVALGYILYIGPFYSILNVTPGGVQEMLSVPLQQLARVHYYDKESFSQEELDYLYKVVLQEDWELYRSTVADFVKKGFRENVYREDPAMFWKLWIKTGVKNPMTYVNSFMLGIVDYFYPFAVVDGYQDVYGASSFFDYRVSSPGKEYIFLPRLHEIYEGISVDKEFQKKPGMFLLLSPGWYLIIFLHILLYLWYQKRYKQMIPMMAVLLYLGTLLLGPIALVRYILILYFIFPVYSIFIKIPETSGDKRDKMSEDI